ncbi:MAG: SDR family oxidoreductase [Candidatus Brocadiae bacterium]|nr:SDR family oxidoreductase [Candidatus Brocadiia bacterium]
MTEYLVTGGAGFIGSHLVEHLLSQGKSVSVLDNLSTGKMQNLEPFLDKIVFYQGDICNEALLDRALEGVRIVFHEAALSSVPRSVKDPMASHLANSEGTLKLLLHAKEKGVKRVIYAGSSSAYGDSEELPKVETMIPKPLSPYASSKLAAEHYCQIFANIYGLETVTLRYFNVFGPRQDAQSEYSAVIPKFVSALQENKKPVIFGDGEQTRDFNYITNVVDANMLASEANGVSGKVFNIAGGKRISLNELLAFIQKIMQTSIQPHYDAPRIGDIRHSLADIDLAKKLLKYEPCVDVFEGLQKTVSWFLKH